MASKGSYLNSNVSLISKALIRYEGTLFSINPQEATITLSNVKSYGTEDRRVDKFLEPKDTLFEYIIFKANDIKELIVDEPVSDHDPDPAILSARLEKPAGLSGLGAESSNIQSNGLSSEQQATLNGLSQLTNAPSISSAGQTNERQKSRATTPSSTHARSPVSEMSSNRQKTDRAPRNNQYHQSNNRQLNHNQPQRRNNHWGNNHNQGNQGNRNYQNNNQRYDSRNRMNSYNHNNNMNRRGQYQNSYHQNQRGPMNNQSGFRPDNRQYQNRNGFRGNQHQVNYHQNNRYIKNGRKVGQPNKRIDPILKTDFDFEAANEQFLELADNFEGLGVEDKNENKSATSENKDEGSSSDATKDKEVDGNYYDKTKSFFDNISCESIERTKSDQQKFDWKSERKINAETFGLKITYRRNDGSFHRPLYLNNGMSYQNRNRYNGNQQRSAPKTTSS